MATIKSYTDLEQSKKLAEILPLESADMYYDDIIDSVTGELFIPADGSTIKIGKGLGGSIAAWSLAALLSVLPKIINNETLFIETSAALWHIGYRNIYTARADNPVDACYELILKLNELKML